MATTIEPPAGLAKNVSEKRDPLEDARWEEPPSTAERIHAVMQQIGDIPKSDHNDGQGYYYRSIDRIVAKTRDAMIEHGLIAVPHRMDLLTEWREGTNAQGKPKTTRIATTKVVYRFQSVDDTDGSDIIEAEVVSESHDSADKAVSQALTAAHKALLLQTFQIGDGGTDSDAARTGGIEFADEATVESIKTRAGLLPDAARPILNFMWSQGRWGMLSQGQVDNAKVGDILEAFHRLEDAFPVT